MVKSPMVFSVLKGCAWLLERILPVRMYVPLYVRCRRFYDMVILGQPPQMLSCCHHTPLQDEEAFSLNDTVTSPEVGDAPRLEHDVPWTLAAPMGSMVLCGGTLFKPEVPFGVDRVQVKALLKPVRTRCELVICCAFKGRHDILERVINESLAARSGQECRWMLAGSTEEDLQFIKMVSSRTNKVAGFVCDNAPLGRKWQTCVQYAYHYYDAKLYAITGSDDILSGKLIEYVVGRHASNVALLSEFAPDLYCANEWLVYSAAGQYDPMLMLCAYKYETAFQPLGAGRFYSRRCLDTLDAHLFDSSRARGLDSYGFSALKAMEGRVEYYTVEDGPIVSVKGEWEQLNSLDAFFKSETLSLNEFSFKGYPLLKESLHGTTFKYLFKPTNLGFQLFD